MSDRVPTLPSSRQLMWPVLVAIRELGGSASTEEIERQLLAGGRYTDEQRAASHGDGRMSELAYRARWAQTLLKQSGLVVNPSRRRWELTERGRTADESTLATALAEGRRTRLDEVKSQPVGRTEA